MSEEDKKPSESEREKKAMERLQFDIPEGATKEQVADMIADKILGISPKESTDQAETNPSYTVQSELIQF